MAEIGPPGAASVAELLGDAGEPAGGSETPPHFLPGDTGVAPAPGVAEERAQPMKLSVLGRSPV